MHERDRELLARMASVNRAMGDITLRLLHVQTRDDEYEQHLRQLGKRLTELGKDLVERADEIGHVIEIDP
ncbi:hypothetical protein [Amycolatopsis suaedae]|uniref:Uncharacterized protein n=1 Tax=Amycolatopsis suaedae TaxID=2510978 RepID=A0A4Q7JF31_9PSEU|nr:hypothetical protein [Amycolatopsis suaedae]RZQ65114.1 hypothetical protein EWH70_04245 [Amycolatopsis suaedae]